MSLQFLILGIIALAAMLVSVFLSIAVVARKALDEKRAIVRTRLHKIYSSRFAALLLKELPAVRVEPRSNSLFKQYGILLQPTSAELSRMMPAARRAHRMAIRSVLLEFARDLSGRSFDRLAYFFEKMQFVDEEMRRLQSRSWWIRAEAAHTLGRLHAHTSIPALTTALTDSHADVREQAMQALVVLKGVESLGTILEFSRSLSRWTTIELSIVVEKFQDAAVPYLIKGLGAVDLSVVEFCIEMLTRIGFVAAVDPLLALVQANGNLKIQAKAIEALGKLGDMRAREILSKFLLHQNDEVRLRAIEAMGRLGGKDALEALRLDFSSVGFEEKVVVARALAATGARGIEFLRSLGAQSDEITAGVARQVLEEYGALEGTA